MTQRIEPWKFSTGCGGLILLVASAVCSTGLAMANLRDDTAAWCEQQWRTESTRFVVNEREAPNYAGLIKQWETYRPKCEGTVAYEARLAIALALSGRFEDAKRALAPVEAQQSPHSNLVEIARLQIDTRELLADPVPNKRARLLAIEKRYRDLVRRYPNWPVGFAALGGVQTTLEMHREAVASLEKGKSADADVWGVYRNLAVSYAALGRYKDALQAADEAIDLKPTLMSDPDFVYAGAVANAGLGDFKSARTALQVLVTKRPGVREDPDFAKTLAFIRSREEKSSAVKK